MSCSSVINTVASTLPISSSRFQACLDTGSTDNLLRVSDTKFFSKLTASSVFKVLLPNNTSISTRHSVLFPFPSYPSPLVAHVFDDATLSTSSISISAFCNAGCVAKFDQISCVIAFNTTVILQGTKAFNDKLWHVTLPLSTMLSPQPKLPSLPAALPSLHAATLLSSDKAYVLFAHASLGSPTITTFLSAVQKGYLIHWPRLTVTLINAHIPHTTATALGHLNQRRQGINSTKSLFPLPDTDDDDLPSIPTSPKDVRRVYVKIIRLPNTVSSDLTGRFPTPSDTGNQYILISEMDGYVHAEAMLSRTHTEYARSFKRVVAFFSNLG